MVDRLPKYKADDNARQTSLEELTPEKIDATPLTTCVRYGPVYLCRAAIGLVGSTSYFSCGKFKSAGLPCVTNDVDGGDWDFDVDDESTSAVLRVAKIIKNFSAGIYSLKKDRVAAKNTALEILRDEVCHDYQLEDIDGVAQQHDATPSENVARILEEEISAGKKRKGKGRA